MIYFLSRCLITSYKIIPVATLTLKLSKSPFMGIFILAAHIFIIQYKLLNFNHGLIMFIITRIFNQN